MIEDMTVRNLSPEPQRSYIHAVAKFSQYFGCSPDRLCEIVRNSDPLRGGFRVQFCPPDGYASVASF